MDEAENEQLRGPRRGRVATSLAAGLALVTGIAIAAASLDEMSATPPPSATPPATASPPTEPAASPPPTQPPALSARAPTVYDAVEDVDRCATTRHELPGPAGAPGFRDDVARISRSVERVRNLEFERRVKTRLVSDEEVGRRFALGIERAYSPAQAAVDTRVLAALRLVPEGLDLYTMSIEVARGTAAGFYNPRRKRLFARVTGAALTPYDEVVLAHEIDHALVDQSLGLPWTLSADPVLGDLMLAHQALGEGDATLAMSQYGAGTLDPAALDAFLARFSSPSIVGYPGVPYVLQRTSGFPYYEGFLFACAAWQDGGWRAVDEMYARPPTSTSEIVFPSRYRSEATGELPPSPPAPGEKWEELVVGSYGVFDLMLMLENADVLRTGSAEAGSHVDDVRGWNGGVLTAWSRGARTLVHLSFLDAGVTEEGRRHREICGVLRAWLHRTFTGARRLRGPGNAGPGRTGLWALGDAYGGLRCAGASVRLAVGPADRVVRRVLRP